MPHLRYCSLATSGPTPCIHIFLPSRILFGHVWGQRRCKCPILWMVIIVNLSFRSVVYSNAAKTSLHRLYIPSPQTGLSTNNVAPTTNSLWCDGKLWRDSPRSENIGVVPKLTGSIGVDRTSLSQLVERHTATYLRKSEISGRNSNTAHRKKCQNRLNPPSENPRKSPPISSQIPQSCEYIKSLIFPINTFSFFIRFNYRYN